MSDDSVRKFLKNLRSADLIWAVRHGGKDDGEFLPLWISQDVAQLLSALSSGSLLNASTFEMRIDDSDSSEVMRGRITVLKGPSAEWPHGIMIEHDQHGGYQARRIGRKFSG